MVGAKGVFGTPGRLHNLSIHQQMCKSSGHAYSLCFRALAGAVYSRTRLESPLVGQLGFRYLYSQPYKHSRGSRRLPPHVSRPPTLHDHVPSEIYADAFVLNACAQSNKRKNQVSSPLILPSLVAVPLSVTVNGSWLYIL